VSYNSTIEGIRPPSFNGSGNIVRIAFNVIKSGNTKLTLESELADKPPAGAVASEIPHITIGGIFSPIHVFLSTPTVTLGENVSISGFTALAQANVNVTIQYRLKGLIGWHNLSTVKTNEKGNYQYSWQPTESGEYEIRATALLVDREETSYLVDLTVKAIAQPPLWQYIVVVATVIAIAGTTATVIYRRSARGRKTRKK